MSSVELLTFLFTDVESSTRLWEDQTERMSQALAEHDRIIRDAVAANDGHVFSTAGDAFGAAFSTPAQAVAAATSIRDALRASSSDLTLAVRIGVHTGTAEARGGDYFGPTLNRAARIMSAGHGGQILVSAATAALLDGAPLCSLGTHRLKDLTSPEEIFQVGEERFPPLATLDRALHNLPLQTTPLVGREAAVASVAALVRDHRLVTLLGIGGTGKTRLAQAVAAEVIDDFPDGVWFVDLVPVVEPERIAEAIGAATGLRLSGDGSSLERLAGALRPRTTLIVLDNCEHLIDGAADVADALVHAGPGVHVLSTSREPLELVEEHRHAVDPLSLDDHRNAPALALFEDAAARVGASLGADEVDDALAVCRHLDGLPLALELAGAQLRHMNVAQLRERMDDRFGLLERGRRRRGHRQDSLVRVLDDTVSLLTDDERALLSQLGAFPSTFDIDGVEGTADEVLGSRAARAFAGLVDRNLVVTDSPGRYRLLETVKLFARGTWPDDSAGSAGEAHPCDRHAQWVLDELARPTREERYLSYEPADWLITNYDDVVATEARLAEQVRTRDLAELYGSLALSMSWPLGNARILAVGERIESALRRFEFTDYERGLLHTALGSGSLGGRRLDWLAEHAPAAVDLIDAAAYPIDHAHAMMLASWGAALSDTDRAVTLAEQAAVLAEEADALRLAAMCHAYRVNHLLVGGRLDEARALVDEVSELEGATRRDYDQASNTLAAVTAALFALRDPERALGAGLADPTSDRTPGGVNILTAVAHAALGDVQAASAELVALGRFFRVAGEDGLPDLLLAPATLAWKLGDSDRAAALLTAIRQSPKPTQNFLTTSVYRQLRDEVGLAPEPPAERVEETWAEARAWMDALGSA